MEPFRGGGAEVVGRPVVHVPAGGIVGGSGGAASSFSPSGGAVGASPTRSERALLYATQRRAVDAAQRGDFSGARAALLANVAGWSALIGEFGAVLEREALRELFNGRAGSVFEMDAELA